MLNILLDGISILNTYKVGIIVFFIAIFGFGLLAIKYIATEELDSGVVLLSSFSLGSIVLSIVSYALILLSHFWPSVLHIGSFAILIFAIFILITKFWSGEFKAIYNTQLIMAGTALLLLLVARLAFLKYIILPPYSDSPIHYQIVQGFLHPELSGDSKLSLGTIFTNYYHFGFHGLAAWLAAITNIEAANIISLLGQLFLVIAPISILFLTYITTKNLNGALFAGLLTATGWLMPAFAVNWGKFPALNSLAVVPSVIGYVGLYLHKDTKKPIATFFVLAFLVGIVLIHTRIVICLFLAGIGYFLSGKLRITDEPGYSQSIRLSLFYIISLWPLSELLLNFYVKFPVLVILLILLPFAFKVYPRLSAGIFFYTFGLWLIMLGSNLLNKNSQTLLDRQFLEIMLYIPFSTLGGAGLAGLLKSIPSTGILRWSAITLLAGCIMLNFLYNNSLYPNPCCDYFKEGDRLALLWLQENSSEHSLVIISTFDNNGKIVGTDAGIWIYPLNRQATNKLPFNTNWEALDGWEKVCNTGAEETYIYMGGRQYSFVDAQLMQAKWIKQVYKAGETVIYQVSECPN